MKLKLNRPIVFFDIESTGINVNKDRIVELALLKVRPDQAEESRTYRFNPEMPIGGEAERVHGISDEMVKDAPTFRALAHEVADFLRGADIAGYNSNRFDVPMLAEEFERAGIDFEWRSIRFVDVQTIFHKMEQRTLGAAYKFYCQKELVNAHSAQSDTQATYEVLQAQLERYPDLKNDIKFLSDFAAHNKTADFAARFLLDKKDREVVNFGKYKGKLLEEVLREDPGFFKWMMEGDFPLYTKRVLQAAKLKLSFPNTKTK